MAITSINPTQTSIQQGAGAGVSSDNLLGSLLQTGAGIYGAQNGAEAQTQGIQAGLSYQQQVQQAIQGQYGQQSALGSGAMTALGSVLGTNGAAPDPSTFTNQPGYQFAVQQGTQAINRQASANGSLYTPNTLDAVGQYVTGTASQNYDNYVNQLLTTAGFGQNANQNISSANLQTGGNISQLDQNQGNAQASGVAGSAGALGSGLNSLGGALGGASGVNSLFGGSGTTSGPTSGDVQALQNSSAATIDNNFNSSSYNIPGLDSYNPGSDNSSGTTTYYGDDSGP